MKTPELSLLSELSSNHYSYSSYVLEMVIVFLIQIELEMNYTAVWYVSREGIIRNAYLDA
eukprot:8595535-Pyramimonas_sp.AAC.1